jgi:hypothetical protein
MMEKKFFSYLAISFSDKVGFSCGSRAGNGAGLSRTDVDDVDAVDDETAARPLLFELIFLLSESAGRT